MNCNDVKKDSISNIKKRKVNQANFGGKEVKFTNKKAN